jgi:mono/diheme cytochrome c family protein
MNPALKPLFVFLAALIAPAVAIAAAPEPAKISAEQEEFFEKRIRPLLVQHCVECHGPEAQESDLRLDSREFLLKGAGGVAVVVPGEPDRSQLIAVTRYDGKVQMPPDGKLPDEELAALASWVRMGAPWPATAKLLPDGATGKENWSKEELLAEQYRQARSSHWAFQPVRRPPLPEVYDSAWCRSPVDRFILAELEKNRLRPSQPAERRTLLRRVTYDLIGLPPSYAEMEAFAADTSPDAYAKAVDRLLASPLYGERWGRHWLDVARYADTRGYVFTQERRLPYSYTYRDYVIDAFNRDLPYDQFLLEQLAADQLPASDGNAGRLAALGFLTLGRNAGKSPDAIDDQIDVVTRGLLGLTAACARCHDHKFDPIPTADYYSLYGIFDHSSQPKELPLLGEPKDTPEYRDYKQELAKRQMALNAFLEKRQAELEEELGTHVGDVLAQVAIDKKIAPTNETFDFADDEPSKKAARRWQDYLNRTARPTDPVWGAWQAFAALDRQKFAEGAAKVVAAMSDSKPPRKPTNRLVKEMFGKTPLKSMFDVAEVYGGLLDGVRKEWLTAKENGAEKLEDPAAEELRLVLFGPGSPAVVPLDNVEGLLDVKFRDEVTKLKRAIDSFMVTSPAAPARAMVTTEASSPRTQRVFLRGNPGRPGPEVPLQFLEVLSRDGRKPFSAGHYRLDLARAIASPTNPLTARVLVNRVWTFHFGTGLVATPSDFGVRSDPPTHPELLDYLASTFVEEGWSIKKLHRLMVLSNAYQQASDDRPDCRSVDPENRLWWHMNRRRLEFEAMRDSLLMAAGKLDMTPGGRPVDLWKEPFPTRRTVYGFIDRFDLPGVFNVFDFADPDISSEQRPKTTVPQQALFAMNSPFALQQARLVSKRPEVASASDPAKKVAALYRVIYGRDAAASEIELGVKFVERIASAPKPPVLPPPPKPAKGKEPPKPPEKPLEPWEMYAQVLLLTNEFIFVD